MTAVLSNLIGTIELPSGEYMGYGAGYIGLRVGLLCLFSGRWLFRRTLGWKWLLGFTAAFGILALLYPSKQTLLPQYYAVWIGFGAIWFLVTYGLCWVLRTPYRWLDRVVVAIIAVTSAMAAGTAASILNTNADMGASARFRSEFLMARDVLGDRIVYDALFDRWPDAPVVLWRAARGTQITKGIDPAEDPQNADERHAGNWILKEYMAEVIVTASPEALDALHRAQGRLVEALATEHAELCGSMFGSTDPRLALKLREAVGSPLVDDWLGARANLMRSIDANASMSIDEITIRYNELLLTVATEQEWVDFDNRMQAGPSELCEVVRILNTRISSRNDADRRVLIQGQLIQ